MSFFQNSTVNLLNLHYALRVFAHSGGGAFYAAWLYKSGLPAPQVLAALACIFIGRFIFRPLILPIAVRTGLRPLLVAGVVISALQYLALGTVSGVSFSLFVLIALAAIGDSFYWTAYHAYFAALGDDEARGRQVGAREAIAAVAGMASPLPAGWMLTAFGPKPAFAATCAFLALSALPLLRTPQVEVTARAPNAFAAARMSLLIFAADGWMAAGWVLSWQIALFVTLGENYLAFGGAMALAALIGAGAGLVLGAKVDRGQGAAMATTAIGVMAFVIALRAAAVGAPAIAVIANALGALAACLLVPAQMTPIYTIAKSAPCPLRFQLVCEAGWDVGGASGLFFCALLLSLGAPLGAAVAAGMPGALVILFLLRRYYGRAARPAAVIAE
jgi:MFS family permease